MAEIATNLQALAERWSVAGAGERANLQMYVIELCEALLVERPRPKGSGYEFELQIDAITVAGTESSNFIDCWKAGHFALEGKDDAADRAGKAANEALLRRAYGQVRNYVHHVPGATPPPYLMVLDVGTTLIVWDRWAGTYGGFEAGRRIDLRTLHTRPDDIALLRDIWENPAARDRRGAAQAVTTEIAGRLAELAAALEGRGHDQEVVARFLMRVVFSCFAEDIGLLPAESFRQTVTDAGLRGSPAEFTAAVEGLWRLMDTGGRVGPMRFLRFNGHFFKDATALPLTREELVLLEAAARADWTEVEPAIFGTLLTRALDPVERHRLGAEFTPPAYIERLVRPTIEEPVLERWTAVQAEVVQLLATEKPKDRDRAATSLRDFHAWLRGLRILDPACGSGNFLYVAMHALKRIELEVLRTIDRVTGETALRMEEVGPWQFYGIEVKPWAREISELVLWIGFHQFWKQHHDVQPPEPILRDTGTLECRDAVLAWTAVLEDPARATLDPTPRLRHPVTGEMVPDPTARRPYLVHADHRPAAWPEADFIVGNPPYIGAKRMRELLGDGYVDALRASYQDVADTADYVAYWWRTAAHAVATGHTVRAGLITTNSITQMHHRGVITAAREKGAVVCWAVRDHPWVDEHDGADVRVALTVIARVPTPAKYIEVDDAGVVTFSASVPRLNDDLTPHADVAQATATRLRANKGLASMGFALHGHGFVLPGDEARRILADAPAYSMVLKRYCAGRDLTQRPRDTYVIDFGYATEAEARQYPLVFDLVRDRVKPERDANRRPTLREKWWQFGWPRRELRTALSGLARFIVTTETAKHRMFVFRDVEMAADHGIVCIASDDPYVLGVLSSHIHVTWALAAGGRLGVGNDPRYNKTRCFDPFPFPAATEEHRAEIGRIAQALETHRSAAVARDDSVTMTGMYNVLAKLRSGDDLTPKERAVHTLAACGTLRDLHDALDRAVVTAYGWKWPESDAVLLERLVVLHTDRVSEERSGVVRWLRPSFQQKRFARAEDTAASLDLTEEEDATLAPAQRALAKLPWPSDTIGQITAVRSAVAMQSATIDHLVAGFVSAKREVLLRHLHALELLGEVTCDSDGHFRLASGALVSA
jgi:hypothetical protein